jgi:hypothetical protein
MKKLCAFGVLLAAVVGMISSPMSAQPPAAPTVPHFSQTVGQVQVKPVEAAAEMPVPYLTWGGDVATFLANGGGGSTDPKSIYGQAGLKLKMVNGDNFVQQVRDYMGGKTPVIRGTTAQIALASDVLGSDPATKPVMLFQLTWSAGDHVVAREAVHTINEFKGKKFALQQGGPHVGLLDDALRAGGLKWTDINVVWTKNLTGEDSPGELFKKDASIDCVCVISPDMLGLTGGLDKKGSGAEGTVKGAHVVVSTAQMSRSVADVYMVRSDFFKNNRDWCEKFTAGYLKATSQLVAWKNAYNDGKGKSPEYMNLLKMAQGVYGEKVLPTLEVDAHGLVSDASFVGLPGNIVYFNDPGNLNGFDAKLKSGLDLAVTLGAAKERFGYDKSGFDWRKLSGMAGLTYEEPKFAGGGFKAEGIDAFPNQNLDDRTLVSFAINFEPNQEKFSIDVYGAEFKRVVQGTQTFGKAAIVIRGHADPTKTLVDFIKAGMSKGIITREGDGKGTPYSYKLNGKALDLTATNDVMKHIAAGDFQGSDPNPQETMQAALNLSQTRAEEVKKSIIEYAKKNGLNLDPSQIVPVGMGIREPLVAKPSNMDEAKRNMRVEFRLVRVNPEAIKPKDFDY